MENYGIEFENGDKNLEAELWDVLETAVPGSEHENRQKLDFIKEKYQFITYEQALEDLGSLDENKQRFFKNIIIGLRDTKDISPELCLFMKAERGDGAFAYAVIAVGAQVKYRADFISPAYYQGHASNHDYNAGQLLGSLYLAATSPAYPTGSK